MTPSTIWIANGIRMTAIATPTYCWNFFQPYDNAAPTSGLLAGGGAPNPPGGGGGGGGGGGTSDICGPSSRNPQTLTVPRRKGADYGRSPTPVRCRAVPGAWPPPASAPSPG